MARPLRIEYPGAFYHVTSRGNERGTVFQSNRDREKYLSYVESAHERYGAVVHTYCLMGNHYHLLLETPRGNLSKILQYSGLNLSEIGGYFGMQRSAISQLSRRFAETIEGSSELKKLLSNIEKEGLLNVAV